MAGKNIYVIGGSSGIGKAVAREAYFQGASVTLTSRTEDKAKSVAQEIGASVIGKALDINDEAAVNTFFDSAAEVDHIYIAAGSTKLGSLSEGTLEENFAAFDTRILGSLRVVKAVVEQLKPLGSITFTGGLSTDRPISGAWVSGLATSTAEQLARVLVMEYPSVRFNAVSPGYTDTPMWDQVLGEQKIEVLSQVASTIPTKKIATSEEVASAVIFLMSNSSVNGEVIHVDGGHRLV